jgi:pantoate--beta-alanine ligase
MTLPASTPLIISTVADLRAHIATLRNSGATIALIPTMGALHEGHLDLVRLAKTRASHAVVSIFVNPKQFAPHEDFDRYPRQLVDDAAKLAIVSADAIWAPTPAEMYPTTFATSIQVGGPALGLETDFRPHFFSGVAAVCCKLFCQVTPDLAIFGEKDYQQLAVIRQMVADLNLPLAILGAPTRRERDGLALSSRNAYLTVSERNVAPALHRALTTCADEINSGLPIDQATARATRTILAAGFNSVDYLSARNAATLGPLIPGQPSRLLAATWLGKTRLIDNIAI